eukprot:GHVS01014619.1.p2 GENE.GHVS01014619.1~~GHVS01014619.1.p2  ORF type:complete len:296 (+),score=93.59 GHVS01014619.1:99-986(+)
MSGRGSVRSEVSGLYEKERPQLKPLKLKGLKEKKKRKVERRVKCGEIISMEPPPDAEEEEEEEVEEVGEGFTTLTGSKRGRDGRGGVERCMRGRNLEEEGRIEEPSSSCSSTATEGEEGRVVEASGRIVTTGTTVQGFATKFMEEKVRTGDELLLQHPKTMEVEERVVVGVLSNRSATIDSPFSSDLISTTNFCVRKTSEVLEQAARKRLAAAAGGGGGDGDEKGEGGLNELVQDEISKRLQRKLTGQQSKKFVSVREKSGMWGYKTISRQVKGNASSEQMLDIRCKQGRDKYCF